ncbi:MAG: M56 family metallopeptidase [Flavobacteriaceae bacterium]
MIFFLIRFTACLAVLLIFYKLYLEKESVHVLKRAYLLVALILSLVIPFITFTFYINAPFEVHQPLNYQFISDLPISELNTKKDYLPLVIWVIYAFGVFIFSIKFLFNLSKTFYKIKYNPKVKSNRFTNVLLKKLVTPHTFFNYIFFNKHQFEKDEIPKEVFLHEQCHAQQKHSLDVLFVELLKIIFWFNPLIYLAKHFVKLNHEFLADQAVLEKGISIPKYQQILLQFTSNKTPQLANAINYSLIKKRFTIMKTQSSKKTIWLRSFLMIPLFAILIYGFSDKLILQKEKGITQQKLKFQKKNKTEGVPEVMMKKYKEFMHKCETTKVIDYPTYKRMVIVYNKMSKKQKESVKKYTKDPFSGSLTAKSPSKNEFNKWKNKKKYAIWLDDKHVNNDILNNYKASDIVFYSGSFVHINARSKRFPQIYQYWIYTKKGFEVFKKNLAKEDENQGVLLSLKTRSKNIEKYKKLYVTFVKLKNKAPHYIYKTKAEQKIIDAIFSELGGMYFRMLREDKNKVNYPVSPIRPYVKFIKNGKEVYKKWKDLTPEDLKLLPFPPKRPSERKNNKNKKTANIYIKVDENKQITLNGKKGITLQNITSETKKITANYQPKKRYKIRAVFEVDGDVNMGFINDVFHETTKAGVNAIVLK